MTIETTLFTRTRDMHMKQYIQLLRCRSAATAIEYALIAGLISLAIIVGVSLIGSRLNTTFSQVDSGLATNR